MYRGLGESPPIAQTSLAAKIHDDCIRTIALAYSDSEARILRESSVDSRFLTFGSAVRGLESFRQRNCTVMSLADGSSYKNRRGKIPRVGDGVRAR